METHIAMMVGGAVGGAIGGAVGVVGSLATSLAPHLFQRYRDKKAARAITRAYISGILHMEEFHDHAHWYEGLISVIELDENQAMKMLGVANADMNDFLRPTVIAQLGLLKPDVAGDLMLFLNMHDGLRINLKAMTLGQLNDHTRQQKLKVLKSDLAVWRDAMALGRKLVVRLK
jgi:hypothetical protein